MPLQIRPVADEDIEAVVQLSLLAWEPVFVSFRQLLGSKIYAKLYPDWQTQQRAGIEAICREALHSANGTTVVLVADFDSVVAGFIAYKLDHDTQTGEVEYLAVHPDYQNRGTGTDLNNFVLHRMKDAGMKLAVVGTGGDEGHAPARRSYEKSGYRPFPLVRYYQDL